MQFITTTLRFVEPNSREKLRERYSANEVIPRDAKQRLLRALFLNAPSQLFGQQALKDGPNISFGLGLGLDDSPLEEVTTVFSRPSRLVDVRLRPLKWALERWQGRARTQLQRKGGFGQPIWDGQLTFLANFDDTLEGRRAWVLRRDSVPLSRFEKWIIRRCFRFRRAPKHETDMPTPESFLEQLVDKIVKQIEDSATTGFRAALAEAIQYHRFILAAQNTRDDAGNAFNLAEVGGFFSRPDQDWVWQYRRAFGAAADKMGADRYFMDRLSNLVTRLVPADAFNYSARVIQTLLQLGAHQVVAREEWITKRAVIGAAAGEVGASAALTGSDKRVYDKCLDRLCRQLGNLAADADFVI